jgi:hypothetical protein
LGKGTYYRGDVKRLKSVKIKEKSINGMETAMYGTNDIFFFDIQNMTFHSLDALILTDVLLLADMLNTWF